MDKTRAFYANIGIDLPDSDLDNLMVHCFANPTAHKRDDRNRSCSVSLATGVWNCKGCGERGNAFNAAVLQGYSSQRARELTRACGLFNDRVDGWKPPKMPTETQLKKWRRRLRESAPLLERLEAVKGWPAQAVVRCGLGWDGERITFPIRSQERKYKCVGLVGYQPGGDPKSKAWPGSKRDLFTAPMVLSRDRVLFVVEGEPDVVSIVACGFQAAGVPGVNSWNAKMAGRLRTFKRVVVLADCDRQGRDLASRIEEDVPRAQIVDIEPGRNDGYDVGDMIREAHEQGGVWQMKRVLAGFV